MKTKESDMEEIEPIMFERFMALESAEEVGHYLTLIRTKQATLEYLELLALQKNSAFELNEKPSTQPQTSLIEIILTSPSDNAVEISTSDKNESEGDTDYGQFFLEISSQPNATAGANDGTLSESEM